MTSRKENPKYLIPKIDESLRWIKKKKINEKEKETYRKRKEGNIWKLDSASFRPHSPRLTVTTSQVSPRDEEETLFFCAKEEPGPFTFAFGIFSYLSYLTCNL